MKIKIVNQSNNPAPQYQTSLSAGMDIHAFTQEGIVLNPMERALVSTGLYIELPPGFEAQVRPRSGLAAKSGITVLNTPGTIDPDYRGEIKVILINLSNIPFTVNNGDRIAQLIIGRFEKIEWDNVNSLNETNRNSGGFGSTDSS
jgi:dUTP pyrophosphatase